MRKVFTQELLVNGSKVYLYVSKTPIEKFGNNGILQKAGYFVYISRSDEAFRNVKLVKLPSEQSLLSLFPLILLYGKEAIDAMDVISWGARILRLYATKVLCFYNNCRKPARYFAVLREGLDDGCWCACSKKHLSQETSKGKSLQSSDYITIDDLEKYLP
jgi:hypothetical protein